ncbi:MAG: hypothetical protein AAFO89_07760 [Planctomycetota bacterium]
MIEPPSTGIATPLAATTQADARNDVAFADIMRQARGAASVDDVRQAAEDLVANAFIAPVLRQMRETSDAAPPFQQTPSEKQFGQMLDIETARQIVRKSDLPIVDRLTQTFEQLQARSIDLREGIEQRVEVVA